MDCTKNIKTLLVAIIIILLSVLIYNKYNKQENFTSTESNEAVQNIVSVYADTSGTVSFNNMQVTGNIQASGNVNFAQFKGIIVAWSGTVAGIPSGWGLCDGTIYTALDGNKLQSPDLRGRFILGVNYGTNYNGNYTTRNIGAWGGRKSYINYK